MDGLSGKRRRSAQHQKREREKYPRRATIVTHASLLAAREEGSGGGRPRRYGCLWIRNRQATCRRGETRTPPGRAADHSDFCRFLSRELRTIVYHNYVPRSMGRPPGGTRRHRPISGTRPHCGEAPGCGTQVGGLIRRGLSADRTTTRIRFRREPRTNLRIWRQ